MNIPSSLTAGDTWMWEDQLIDYPAPAWTLTYYFENATEKFSAVAAASGSVHQITVAPSTSATRKAGRYLWSARVSNGTSTFTIATGWVDVIPDPASTVKRDPRSWARRTLEAIEAFLEGNATTAQQAMSIAGRSISRWSIAELTQWRDRLRAEVKIEEQAESAGLGRHVKVRF